MFSIKLLVFIAISGLELISSTTVNGGEPIWCVRAEVTEVRVHGCAHEPCILTKGTNLPLEIDFKFEFPKSMKEASLTAFLAYWNVPGEGAFGSYLTNAYGCSQLQLQCPATSGEQYTSKTNLYADPRLQSNFSPYPTTGNVTTTIYLRPSDPDAEGSEGYSLCSFNLDLTLVEPDNKNH